MMKFFRKYNKHMLAVFMALLLVVWLGGSALTSMFAPDPAGQVIGTSRLGDIRVRDVQHAEGQTRLMSQVGLPWNTLRILQTPLDYVDWVLLSREADRLGVQVDRTQAVEFMNRSGADASIVLQIARRQNLKPDVIYDAVASFMKVQKLFEHMYDASSTSDAEVQALARQYFETAKINAVVLSPASFIDNEEPVSEEQIKAQFDKAREQKRDKGLTFGYLLPPRVKAQYIKIDLAKVQESKQISPTTLERKAREYWEERKNSDPAFRRPIDPAATQPSTQSVFFETFEEARAAAEAAVLKEEASSDAEQLADRLVGLTAEPWFEVSEDEDGYKTAPDAVKADDYYTALIGRLSAAVRNKDALSVHTSDWITEDTADQTPNLGSASTYAPGGGMSTPFARLAFSVQGLATVPKDDRTDRSGYLSHYQTAPRPLKDAAGNFYVVRIVAAEPARPPQSVDEVRDAVIADIRQLNANDRALDAAEKLADVARSSGLRNAWDGNEMLRSTVKLEDGWREPPPFSRQDPMGLGRGGMRVMRSVIGIGMVDDEFRRAAFALDDQPADQAPIAVIPQPDLGLVVVAELVETKPVTKPMYESNRTRLRTSLLSDRLTQTVAAWFTPDQIRARHDYKPSREG